MGLDPGTLGSCPEPKAAAQLLSHPGILNLYDLNQESLLKQKRKYQWPLNMVTFQLFWGDRKVEHSFKELTGQSRYKSGMIKSRQAAKYHLAQLIQQPFA